MEKALVLPEKLDGQTPAEMRSKIVALEECMKGMTEHHIDIQTIHHFAPGVYMREVVIPAGATVTGKIHKTEHLNIVSQGDITVWTEDGMKRVQAGTVIKSKPGMKRVGYAHSETRWITVHPTTETDLEKLEDMLIAKTFEEALQHLEPVKIEGGEA